MDSLTVSTSVMVKRRGIAALRARCGVLLDDSIRNGDLGGRPDEVGDRAVDRKEVT